MCEVSDYNYIPFAYGNPVWRGNREEHRLKMPCLKHLNQFRKRGEPEKVASLRMLRKFRVVSNGIGNFVETGWGQKLGMIEDIDEAEAVARDLSHRIAFEGVVLCDTAPAPFGSECAILNFDTHWDSDVKMIYRETGAMFTLKSGEWRFKIWWREPDNSVYLDDPAVLELIQVSWELGPKTTRELVDKLLGTEIPLCMEPGEFLQWLAWMQEREDVKALREKHKKRQECIDKYLQTELDETRTLLMFSPD